MALSNEELGNIDSVVGEWCLFLTPPEIKKRIDYDYEIEGQAVTIFEVRPDYRGKSGQLSRNPFVKFRYVKTTTMWHIYWMRASGKWQAYEPHPVVRNLKEALKVVDTDKYGCFFG